MNKNENNDKVIKNEKKIKIGRIIIYFLLSIWALIVLFPFYWMIITSLKSSEVYNSEIVPSFFPKMPTFENYERSFAEASLLNFFGNTIIFSVVTTIIMLTVTTLASFAFARLNFKGKNLAFTFLLALMMIPSELVVITNRELITNLDLRNTFTGLILPSITSVFYIYLLKENFESIPDEMYYAAKVDGTTDVGYLTRIMIPLCKPTIVTITILKVIECWNSYIWPKSITDQKEYYLVSNGIQLIRENASMGRENVPIMMASVVVVSLPLIIIFLIFKRQIMTGVSKSGLKG